MNELLNEIQTNTNTINNNPKRPQSEKDSSAFKRHNRIIFESSEEDKLLDRADLYGHLPESRESLIQLNKSLDELVKDVLSDKLPYDQFSVFHESFINTQLSTNIAMNERDCSKNCNVKYDTSILKLTQLALKKIEKVQKEHNASTAVKESYFIDKIHSLELEMLEINLKFHRLEMELATFNESMCMNQQHWCFTPSLSVDTVIDSIIGSVKTLQTTDNNPLDSSNLDASRTDTQNQMVKLVKLLSTQLGNERKDSFYRLKYLNKEFQNIEEELMKVKSINDKLNEDLLEKDNELMEANHFQMNELFSLSEKMKNLQKGMSMQ